MVRVKPEEPRIVDENDFEAQVREYAFIKKQLEYLEQQQKNLRAKLFDQVEAKGEPDSTGNVVVELDNEIEGFASIIKQRRVSRKLNEEAAEEIITARGLEEKLYKTVRVIDEDAVMAALYSDELTEQDIDNMFEQKVVWALVMSKR